MQEARTRKRVLPQATEQSTLTGKGIEAQVEGQHIRLSAPDKLPPETLDSALLADINARESQGETVIVALRDGVAYGSLCCAIPARGCAGSHRRTA